MRYVRTAERYYRAESVSINTGWVHLKATTEQPIQTSKSLLGGWDHYRWGHVSIPSERVLDVRS